MPGLIKLNGKVLNLRASQWVMMQWLWREKEGSNNPNGLDFYNFRRCSGSFEWQAVDLVI